MSRAKHPFSGRGRHMRASCDLLEHLIDATLEANPRLPFTELGNAALLEYFAARSPELRPALANELSRQTRQINFPREKVVSSND